MISAMVLTYALRTADAALRTSKAADVAIQRVLELNLQATRGLRPADIWTAILLGHITRCALSVVRFRQGKWRGIKVAVEPA